MVSFKDLLYSKYVIERRISVSFTKISSLILGSPPQATKRKLSDSEDKAEKASEQPSEKQAKESNDTKVLVLPEDTEVQTGALKCVAILPGLGSYDDSSDSDNSSDSEPETTCKQVKIDMLGREILPPKEKEEGH